MSVRIRAAGNLRENFRPGFVTTMAPLEEGSFNWAPDDDFVRAFAGAGLPEEVQDMLFGRGARRGPVDSGDRRASAQCTGRSSEWYVDGASGVPCRITVLSPPSGSPVTPRVLRAATGVFLKLLGAVDSAAVRRDAGPGAAPPHARPATPARPSSIDMLLLLWDGKKGLPAPGRPVEPRHVNTGMCTRFGNGKTHIMVYRREEAAKTMAHELLHAYQSGEWCNGDPDVLRGSGRIVRECLGSAESPGERGAGSPAAADRTRDRRVPGLLKPTEAITDALALDICRSVFGGASESGVIGKARIAARRLAAHFRTLDPSSPMQTTPAAEYYVLKLHLLLSGEELRRAHSAGFQRPDKKAVRRVFLSAPPVGIFLPRARLPRPVEGASMRMSPKTLTLYRGGRTGRAPGTAAGASAGAAAGAADWAAAGAADFMS